MPYAEPRRYPLPAVDGICGDILPAEVVADVKGKYRTSGKRIAYYAFAVLEIFIKAAELIVYHTILYCIIYL